jgi:hypothetical protein
MKPIQLSFLLGIFLFLSACDGDESSISDEDASRSPEGHYGMSDGGSSTGSGGEGGEGGDHGNGGEDHAGVVTAAEWNDLDNWTFWEGLLNGQDFSEMPEYWGVYTNNRMAFQVNGTGGPLVNAKIEILKEGSLVGLTRTDNMGRANLWLGLHQKEVVASLSGYSLKINGTAQEVDLKLFAQGVNELSVNTGNGNLTRVELAFIVDATGSMGDELEFLKADLKSVIETAENENAQIDILTGTVFYRDEGDEYVVKHSGFTADIDNTLGFIGDQVASGGGDYPEAVHTALKTAMNELQWSDNARTRIAFLILDAPPHYQTAIVNDIHESIKLAAEMGIKLIPVTASGIDKETEFLMRFMAMVTNGTYVFITNDSGVGNDHLEASVGDYEVELLNDLMVRLIKIYAE